MSLKKKIISILLVTSLSLLIFSGCSQREITEVVDTNYDSTEVTGSTTMMNEMSTFPYEDESSSFTFSNLNDFSEDNGDTILLVINSYDDTTKTVELDGTGMLFSYGAASMIDYSDDFSSYSTGRGPYTYQLVSPNSFSIMGYANVLKDTSLIGTDCFLLTIEHNFYASSHEEQFVTKSGLDWSTLQSDGGRTICRVK